MPSHVDVAARGPAVHIYRALGASGNFSLVFDNTAIELLEPKEKCLWEARLITI